MGSGTSPAIVAGRYRLEAHLGSGGMGTVWRAWDQLLGRAVAMKEVRIPEGMPAPAANQLRQRYLREARAAARLTHPGVVGLYDVIPEETRVWIVMELVQARDLAQLLRDEGPMDPRRVAQLGRRLLDALDAAHAVGVLHRDVKPANVLVCADDRAVLTDFGVAAVIGDPSLTQTGQLIGSPAYLAPERLLGHAATFASDLWSLGCTLFAAVEGGPPFLRDDQFALITAITSDPVPAPRRAGPLTPILAGLLHKEPEERWTADRARAALAWVGQKGAALPPSALLSPRRPSPTSVQQRLPVAPSIAPQSETIITANAPAIEVDPASSGWWRARWLRLALGATTVVAVSVAAGAALRASGVVEHLVGDEASTPRPTLTADSHP